MPKCLQYYIGGEGSLRTPKNDYVICARPLKVKKNSFLCLPKGEKLDIKEGPMLGGRVEEDRSRTNCRRGVG